MVYEDGVSLQDVIDNPNSHESKFLGWMDANRKYLEARNLTCSEFPAMFVWNKSKYKWTKSKKGFAIGRLQFIHLGSGQLYYMRIFLNHVRGAKSFDDIRTINNIIYGT